MVRCADRFSSSVSCAVPAPLTMPFQLLLQLPSRGIATPSAKSIVDSSIGYATQIVIFLTKFDNLRRDTSKHKHHIRRQEQQKKKESYDSLKILFFIFLCCRIHLANISFSISTSSSPVWLSMNVVSIVIYLYSISAVSLTLGFL